jgi:hypothetical protein
MSSSRPTGRPRSPRSAERRMREPLEQYLDAFAAARDAVTRLLEDTADLTALLDKAAEVLADTELLAASRYLPGPPISADDLKVLAVDASLAPARIRANPGMARQIIEIVLLGLDRRRFPWLAENREPSNLDSRGGNPVEARALGGQGWWPWPGQTPADSLLGLKRISTGLHTGRSAAHGERQVTGVGPSALPDPPLRSSPPLIQQDPQRSGHLPWSAV